MDAGRRSESVDRWLVGADSSHPVHDPSFPPEFRDALERILRSIDDAEPLRVARKRDAFREIRSFDQLLEQRAELLAASMLARAGIEFGFAVDFPDLLLGSGSSGIEVGTRTLDSPWGMHEALASRLVTRPELHVALSFDERPLKLAATRCEEVVQRIAGGTFAEQTTTVRFDDLGLTAIVTRRTDRVGSPVSVSFGRESGSRLTPHMAEVEREIENKIAQKRRQTEKIPTLLLLDVARVGWAWLRPQAVWLPVLEQKRANEGLVGLGLMVSTLELDVPLEMHIVLDGSAPRDLGEAADALRRMRNRE